MSDSTDCSDPVGVYRSWLPRLTSKVMLDLKWWMLAFGALIGLAFPFAVVLLGVSRDVALRPGFFAATLVSGLIVGEVNHLLARAVVGVRLRSLVGGMRRVEGLLLDASRTGTWVECDPRECTVPVDSTDELGDVAKSFNALVAGLYSSHRVSEGISTLSKELAAHLELNALSRAALAELSSRIGCDASALLVVANGRVTVAGSRSIREADQLVSTEAVVTVLRTGKPVVLRLPDDVLVAGTLIDFVPQEVQILPVRLGVATVGVLVVAFKRPSGPEARAMLTATLPSLAVALNNTLNHEDLQRVAALDPLTSVYNRRFGLQRLKEEFSRSIRSGDPLGVLMFDLDHFKAINDTYGHLVGDRALQAVVRATRQVLREGDVFLRYGGEEFMVVLPGAGLDTLTTTAERIRHAVSEAEITASGQRILVTVSVGGSGVPDSRAADSRDLIGMADAALYSAKDAGRDRYVIA